MDYKVILSPQVLERDGSRRFTFSRMPALVDTPLNLYDWVVSKAQIIEELPKLSPDDRREILHRIQEIDHDGWLADDLSAEELALIESRLASHRKDPTDVVAWSEIEGRLSERFRK
jgi:putative addiction module component (TIGR02574 family)